MPSSLESGFQRSVQPRVSTAQRSPPKPHDHTPRRRAGAEGAVGKVPRIPSTRSFMEKYFLSKNVSKYILSTYIILFIKQSPRDTAFGNLGAIK